MNLKQRTGNTQSQIQLNVTFSNQPSLCALKNALENVHLLSSLRYSIYINSDYECLLA